MAIQNLRRQPRASTSGPIKIAWQDPTKGSIYLRARCVDASENGLKIETSEPIPKLGLVSVQAPQIGFSGTASVRHVTRTGIKYVVGLQLSHPIPRVWLEKHELLKPALETQGAE